MFQEVDLTRITAQVNGVHRQILAYKRQVFSQNMHRGTKERGCLEFEIESSKIGKTCLIDCIFFFFLSEYSTVLFFLHLLDCSIVIVMYIKAINTAFV